MARARAAVSAAPTAAPTVPTDKVIALVQVPAAPKYRLIRLQLFGSVPGVCANALSKAQVDVLLAERQVCGDGFGYTVEADT